MDPDVAAALVIALVCMLASIPLTLQVLLAELVWRDLRERK
jgi:hypothetical protein